MKYTSIRFLVAAGSSTWAFAAMLLLPTGTSSQTGGNLSAEQAVTIIERLAALLNQSHSSALLVGILIGWLGIGIGWFFSGKR